MTCQQDWGAVKRKLLADPLSSAIALYMILAACGAFRGACGF
jgi:hypothetical protein